MTQAGPRVAVVQLQAVHDEVVPSVLDTLAACGAHGTAYLNERIRERGDVVATFTPYADRVRYVDLAGAARWDALADEIGAEHDVLLLNSFSRDGAARFAARTGLPAIGVVHNPDLVTQSAPCVEALRSGAVQPAALAPHVAATMMQRHPDLFARTVVLGAWMWEMAGEPAADGVLRLVVPGAVDLRNRDHERLLDELPAAVEASGRSRSEVEVLVVGGGRDRAHLESEVTRRGLDDLVRFAPVDPSGSVLSADYFPPLAGADFLLPLLPEGRSDYRVSKISASVSASLGFTVPTVVDRWTASVYDLPSVDYPLGDLHDGLVRALRSTVPERAALRERLAVRRREEQARAARGLALALEGVGVAPVAEPPGRDGSVSVAAAAAGAWTAPVDAPRSPVALDPDDVEQFLAFAQQVVSRSHARRLQDLWALWRSGFRRDGWFAEVGVFGGRDWSTTYLLERVGWRGVVSEPLPGYADRVRAHRRCAVDERVVLDRTGVRVPFAVVRGRPALSGVLGHDVGTDTAGQLEHDVHELGTVSLDDLLEEAGAPAVVDFVSLDVAGAEPAVLAAHDPARRPVRLLSVAHHGVHRETLHGLLTSRGYRRTWPEVSGPDDWYVLGGAHPDWSTEGLRDLVAATSRVPAFTTNVVDRQNLLLGLRLDSAVDAAALGIPAPVDPPGTDGPEADATRAAARHARALHRRLTDGQDAGRVARRAVRLLPRLAGPLDVSLVVRLGTAGPGPASDAADRAAARAGDTTPVPLRVLEPGDPFPGAPRPDLDLPDAGHQRVAVVLDPAIATSELLRDAEELLAATRVLLVRAWSPRGAGPRWSEAAEGDLAALLGARGLVPVAGDGLEPGRGGVLWVRREDVGHPAVAREVAAAVAAAD